MLHCLPKHPCTVQNPNAMPITVMQKIIFALIFSLTSVAAQAQTNRLMLKDGQIGVQTNRTLRVLDYSKEDKYSSAYQLDRWQIIEKTDPVREALKVYEKKSEPLYTRRFWIINKDDQNRKIVLEYTSHDLKERVIFTPEEDFVYYVNRIGEGPGVVTGMNLLTGKPFILAQSGSFYLSTCPDRTTYVVVKDTAAPDTSRYLIYSKSGENVDTVVFRGAPAAINTVICK